MRRHTFACACALLAILITACGAAQDQAANESIQTWIDAPLNNDSIPLETYPLLMHSNSPQGIKSFQLSVDGQVLDEFPPEPVLAASGEASLYSASYDWMPPEPGSYVLSVRPLGTDGTFGPSAVAQVTVIGEYTDLSNFTPEVTPEPTATLTATPAATEFATGFGSPDYSATQVYWGRRGCSPTDLTVEIMHANPNVYSLVLFYRIDSTETADQTDWMAKAMNPVGDGYYQLTLMPEIESGDVLAFRKAMINIQVVATDSDGNEIDRTPVFSDVMLDYCVPG